MESLTQEKKDMITEAQLKLSELQAYKEVEQLIQDNIIEWEENNIKYKVKIPGRREKVEIKEAKNKKFNELIKDPKNVTEKEIIKILLNREIPINIEKKRKAIINLEYQINNLKSEYTEAFIESNKQVIKSQITELEIEQSTIQEEINELLSTSIEKQILDFINEYLLYVCFQVKKDGKWQRYFKSYDDFLDSENKEDESLIYKASWYLAVLINKYEQ